MQEPREDGPVKVVDRRWWARQQQAGAEGQASAEAQPEPASKPTYVEELERQLAEKDRHLNEVLLKYRDAAREFDDARARLRKEVAKDVERGRRTLIVEMLDVLDNLDRALDAGRAANPEDALLKGVEIVRQQFLAKLEGFGVRRIDPLGAVFDPVQHEAVSTVPTADPAQDHRVCGVVRPGYAIGDEVLRPAVVAVSQQA